MEEQAAWEQFQQTGSIAAYLQYCQVKQPHPDDVRSEGDTNADQHRWPSDRRASCGGE